MAATGGAEGKASNDTAANAAGGVEDQREAKLYAINVKPGGRVHRLSIAAAQQPVEKRRALCGWRTGHCVARPSFCARAGSGKLCRKCFQHVALFAGGDEDDDAIEQFP